MHELRSPYFNIIGAGYRILCKISYNSYFMAKKELFCMICLVYTLFDGQLLYNKWGNLVRTDIRYRPSDIVRLNLVFGNFNNYKIEPHNHNIITIPIDIQINIILFSKI